jgi:WD40 repeat protein
MLTIGIDRTPVTFAAHGEYLVSGGTRGVQVWRVEDGKLLATMEAEQVQCVAFSRDGKWIAAGTFWGDVMVWDAKIFKQIFTTWRIDDVIRGVDFSPDATRLVALGNRAATVWDIATRERVVRPLRHENSLLAAKYSPNGDRIATATRNSVRVYDSNNGHLFLDIPVQVTTRYNTGLLWFNNDLFVVSDNQIKQIDASTGSTIWESPDVGNLSCIAIPRHGEFIACSANRIVTFWDTSTHTSCGVVHHPEDIHSIALSPDGRFLAIGENEKVIFKRLSRITVCIVASLDYGVSEQLLLLRPIVPHGVISTLPSQEPDIQINDAMLARLQHWDEANANAEEVPALSSHIR